MVKIYNPTQEEIKAACQKIIDNSTEQELQQRAERSGFPVMVWTVPVISSYPSYDHHDN